MKKSCESHLRTIQILALNFGEAYGANAIRIHDKLNAAIVKAVKDGCSKKQIQNTVKAALPHGRY